MHEEKLNRINDTYQKSDIDDVSNENSLNTKEQPILKELYDQDEKNLFCDPNNINLGIVFNS